MTQKIPSLNSVMYLRQQS